ncbi:hypothetical protein EV715DRAFT_295449 [Schizophyllum commune]
MPQASKSARKKTTKLPTRFSERIRRKRTPGPAGASTSDATQSAGAPPPASSTLEDATQPAGDHPPVFSRKPKAPTRFSERIRKRKADAVAAASKSSSVDATQPASTPSPPTSTASDESVRDTLANRDLDYNPDFDTFRATAEEQISAQGYIDGQTPRPARQPLIDISPLGDRCVATLTSNQNGTVNDAHHMPHAAPIHVLRGMAKVMGKKPGTVNPSSRFNRCFLEMAIHHSYDNDLCAFFPMMHDLLRLLRAMQKLPIPSADGEEMLQPPADGSFYHHRKVFPIAVRELRLVFFAAWGDGVPVTCRSSIHEDSSLQSFPPFVGPNGEEIFPRVSTHCDPYYLVWRASEALEKGAIYPSYVENEAFIIKRIGALMRAAMEEDA